MKNKRFLIICTILVVAIAICVTALIVKSKKGVQTSETTYEPKIEEEKTEEVPKEKVDIIDVKSVTRPYAIVVNNILAIEYNIVTFMKKHNIEDKKDGYENINNLVNYFKEDNDVINGLMYLNYILYEKSGLNLRNNAVHGTLINNKLDISLMVTFSGLIFVSWLLNEK